MERIILITKRILLLPILSTIILLGCNQSKSTDETLEVSEPETSTEEATSYELLKTLLDTKQPVYGDYLLIDGKPGLEGMVQEHLLQQESDKYVIVRSRDGGTMQSKYYILSFSKLSGKLVSFVPVGMETEGVEPMKVTWQSPTSFSAVEYNYELVEDEESGAYMKGSLIDSVVVNYQVSLDGRISSMDLH